MNVLSPIRDVSEWDALSSEERQVLTVEVAAMLPASWRFVHLETHSLGGAVHEIAFFDYKGAMFALVPGSRNATLGYDSTHPWVPAPELIPDIQSTEEMIGDDFIANSMTPLRRVPIEPFLIEVRPTQATWIEEREEDDSLEVADIAATYRRDGFRLPTSDEWEYACAAGTRTLWRWGDTIPFAESYQAKDGKEYSKPSAFGVIFHDDTYWVELCDGGEIRGGDGGTSVCGGYGIVAGWIPLASAYREEEYSFCLAPIEYSEQMCVRRAWSLSG